STEGHRGAILFFHCRQVSEVKPLHGLLCILGWHRYVEPIGPRHLLEFFEGTNLLAQFFSIANDLIRGKRRVETGFFLLLLRNESSNSIQSNASIVADNSTSSVR